MSDYVHEISAEESARIARFLRWLAIGTVLFVVLIIALFLSADNWLRIVSPAAERRFIEPYIEWSRENLLTASDPVLQAYVDTLTADLYARLGPDDEQQLRVYVVEGEMLNAFATLGGYIFVFEELVRAVEHENGLAMVLAHEIAHVHNRDPLSSAGRGILLQLALSTLSGSGVDPQSIDTGSDILLNQYSREQELAADKLALSLVQRKFGHVGGATQLFEIIAAEGESIEIAEFLSTHPDTDARIDKIESLTAENRWAVEAPAQYPEDVQEVLLR